MIDHILVQRFIRLYPWWFDESIYSGKTLRFLRRHDPISEYVDELKKRPDDMAWHFGRVRFFYDELRAGRELEPITVDNECSGMHVLPEPILIDGHHRLAAHWFAKRRTIPTYYSGRIDLLEYLKGERRVKPAA